MTEDQQDQPTELELLQEGDSLRKAELEQQKAEFAERQHLTRVVLGAVFFLVAGTVVVYGLAQVDLPWRHAFFCASAFVAFVTTAAAPSTEGESLLYAVPSVFVTALTYPWW